MNGLHGRIIDFLEEKPGSTIEEIARGVRARTSEVRDVLLGGGFSSTQRLQYPSDRALVYSVAPEQRDGSGRAKKPSQCDQILAVLRDREWHTTAEIHRRCGFSRLNSRISDLRKRGHVIDSDRIEGVPIGPDAYKYLLVATSEEVARDCADSLPGPASDATSSDAVDEPIVDPAFGEQLSLGEAA